ncbi:MAG: hypothetical protein RL757_3329 [Bacteroidota bacterium]|jgi:hypothetical protein
MKQSLNCNNAANVALFFFELINELHQNDATFSTCWASIRSFPVEKSMSYHL